MAIVQCIIRNILRLYMPLSLGSVICINRHFQYFFNYFVTTRSVLKEIMKAKNRQLNITAFNRSFGTLLLYMDVGREPESVVLWLISQRSKPGGFPCPVFNCSNMTKCISMIHYFRDHPCISLLGILKEYLCHR